MVHFTNGDTLVVKEQYATASRLIKEYDMVPMTLENGVATLVNRANVLRLSPSAH